MDRNLDTLRRHGRRWLAATGLLALAAAGSAHAGTTSATAATTGTVTVTDAAAGR